MSPTTLDSHTISSPLLDLIRSQGMLDDLQLDEVKEEHNRSGKSISEILQDFGLMDMDQQLQIIATQMGTEVVDISQRELTPEILSAVPADAARMYKCLPVAVTDTSVHVALADPLDPTIVDQLAYVIRKEIVPVVADPAAIEEAVGKYYGDAQSSVADIIKELGQDNEIAREAAEAAASGATTDWPIWPMRRRSFASSILSSFKPCRTAPVIFTLNRSRTNSKSATASMARSMKCRLRPSIWRCRSFPV